MALVIPANSYHPVTITAQVLEAGILMVRGCIVQAPGGAPREFVLPVSSEDEESKRSRRRSAIENEAGRSKHAGLDSRLWKKQEKRYSKANTPAQPTPIRFLECKVVSEQPFLRIRRTSLTHGALMLYNGEKSSIRITLENTSSLPIDFMRLTFDDSTVAPAQQALADGGLSVFDTYETEYDLIHKPVFTWDSKASKQEIGPGEKTVVTVNCFGKVGCASGVVHVSYSYFHRPRTTLDQPSDIFHTRQLSYPVLVTVYHMLECHAMDILPYSPDSTFATIRDSQGFDSDTTTTKIGLIVDDITDWCIFSIEVRNTYGLPFEVTFERQQAGAQIRMIAVNWLTTCADTEPCLMTSVVPPGSMSRVLIPVQKFHLAEEHISRPIPTLSDRQFILTKSNLTSAEERTQQELFWYREELLKLVRGRWKESGGTRTGDLSLRNQRMTQRMVEVLRTEIARIQLSLWHYKDDGSEPSLVPCSGDIYTPPLNDFVYLRAKVMNLSRK
ncbi:hypothetical protein PHLCEN_2v10109 [Hermanssonia centrifuga]|uniref:Uncharacterized protein n=1 Tax=Hermanssonia centrifuga TaxID=98765 RepID=A0A2R6NNZ7_9APHY|nr:hypothetical protein PHLCEN_2v10109 [Hermanssonia centrifuga]